MAKLFSTLKIKDLYLKNRIIMSPMCQYSAYDGFANNWHMVHYGTRAIGGVSVIIQEATAVNPQGRITYRDLGLWKDEHITKLKEITNFIEESGAIPGVQLAHAGRKGSCEEWWKGGKQIFNEIYSWQNVAPSALVFNEGENPPKKLSIEEIKKTVTDFKDAAQRAIEAGYKILEIHAAHGYLIHQFFSPLSNKRTDEYGGSFENRTRFLIEIVDSINHLITNNHSLWVRISATDWVEGGWSLEESIKLTSILKEKGVDVIDVSSGGLTPDAKIKVEKNFQVPFAEKIKNSTGIITGTVGTIEDAKQAEEILENNQADLVFMGRELLRNPYFPFKASEILNHPVEWMPQYIRAKKNKII